MKKDNTHLYSNNKTQYQKPFKHSNYGLTTKQFSDILGVINNAHDNGYELNRFWTIHLKGTPYEKNPQKLLNQLMKNTREWLKRRGAKFVYVWVLENGKYKGIHAHIMMRVPRGMQNDYKKALYGWTGLEKDRFKHVEIMYPPWDFLRSYKNAHGVRKYICKGWIGKNEKTHRALGDIIPSFQGRIIGRRCGMSWVI
jgi:hypothetical protein